jgi:ABC-type multidrug transport system fused ATPase/permease subunit
MHQAWQTSIFLKSFKMTESNSKVKISEALGVLSKSDKRKLVLVSFIQTMLATLDLIGVFAIGLLGALSISGIQSKQPNQQVLNALTFLQIESWTFEQQAFLLAICSVVLLVGRTILSIVFTRRILRFMSHRGAVISSRLVSQFLSQPLLIVQKWSTQQALFAVTRGVEILTLEVLALAVVMIADIALLIILALGLLLVDPVTFLGVVVIFGVISLALHKLMNERAGKIGTRSAELSIKSNEKITEIFSSYRESIVRNRREFYAQEIAKTRFEFADTRAEIGFMPYISKYVIETSVLVGAVLLAAVQFILNDVTQAVTTMAVFAAAGSRIAPAVLRIQQGSIMMKSSLGMAKPTVELINFLGISPVGEALASHSEINSKGFVPSASISNLVFSYPGKEKKAIDGISFEINEGIFVGIVGPSGAGKTTLVDIMLGIIEPTQGVVSIAGLTPSEAIKKWPGSIAYVPQDVFIVNGSIRENVALGYPTEMATEDLVNQSIAKASLSNLVKNLPAGLDTTLGERGSSLSGGERQRLGIARALFTNPKFLILDEATSALDGKTEEDISKTIVGLRGQCTVVVIAHRLSTVRTADLILYIDNGKLIAHGTFEEVRQQIPSFDLEVKKMGE